MANFFSRKVRPPGMAGSETTQRVAACRVPRSDRSPVAAGSREVKGLTPCKVALSGSALGGYSLYARSKPGRPVSPCCEVFVVMELSGPVNIVDEV